MNNDLNAQMTAKKLNTGDDYEIEREMSGKAGRVWISKAVLKGAIKKLEAEKNHPNKEELLAYKKKMLKAIDDAGA